MLCRLLLAAILAGLSTHAEAQQHAQGQRMMLVDERGLPISAANGSPSTIGSSSAASAGIPPVVTQSGTALVGKAGQGNLYSAYALNTTATAGYLACINATAVPAGGAAITPIDVQTLAGTVAATASINYGAGPPNAYSAGIVCLVTTSLTTYTAGGASFIQARVR